MKQAFSIKTALLGKKTILALFVLNIALLSALFFESLTSLTKAWQTDEYNHGPLIPLVAILIGWHRLVERKPRLKPDWMGVLLLGIGMLFLAISRLSAFEPPAHYGFLIALVGLSLAFFGRSFTAALAPAFIYLLFAIPLPRLIYVALSADMQLFSSTLGVTLLQFFGMSVFQEGNVIDLGGYKLQVVEACGGLRYLFPLMSFSFLMAFLFDDRMWKRVILFLSATPITIGMNALRIALIGVTVDSWGIKMADGLLHDLEGWVVFLCCVLLLFAEMELLKHIAVRGAPKGRFRYEVLGFAHGALTKGEAAIRGPIWATVALSSLVAFLFIFGVIGGTPQENTPPHPAFAAFPTQFDDWHGKPETLSPEILTTLQLSDYWMADYNRALDQAPVSFYMAYYGSQRVGSSIHSPSNCLPGSGWQIETRTITPIGIGTQTIPVTRMLIRKGEAAMLVYYWFDGRGRILNEQYDAKWYLLIDSMTIHRTDGALVRVATPILTGEAPTTADQRLQAFLTHAYPLVQLFVPGK